jgi:four helix bundle protein
VAHLLRERRYLADQLQRALVSIPLNIAEGAGEFSRRDKRRFYRIALRSATESAAILDVCRRLEIDDGTRLRAGRDLLLRIVAMLTRLTKAEGEPGTGSGSGSGTD